MATLGLGRRGVTALVARKIDAGAADRDLLTHFAGGKDEAAFAALVRRHGAMVLAAARRVLGNAHDAEDVCQATFLLLAKKASSSRWGISVAPWLHRTAHLLALKARTAAARRARREGRAARPEPANPLAEMTGQELLAVLDAELLALPESLRAPLVLCYLGGATRDEAAERLGCPLSTLKNRLERGRDRLHAALARRGLGLSAVLLGTLLIRQSTQAVPATLIEQTAQAAAAMTAGRGPGGFVPAVARLVDGGVGMSANKIKTALGVLLIGGLLSVAGLARPGPGTTRRRPRHRRKRQPRPRTRRPPSWPPPVGRCGWSSSTRSANRSRAANVHVGIWTNETGFKSNQDVETDATGAARAKLPKTYYIVRLWASKKSFADLYAGWEQAELAAGQGVPAEYTFRLEPAGTAGGRVLDESGKPIAGAKVLARLSNAPKPVQGDGRVNYNGTLAWGDDAPKTDADGRWRMDNVPDRPEVEFSLFVTHPDFVSNDRWVQSGKTSGLTAAGLRAGTATLKLKAGVIVTRSGDRPGRQAGQGRGRHPRRQPRRPLHDGKFADRRRGPLPPAGTAAGQTPLTVMAPGWAPQLRMVRAQRTACRPRTSASPRASRSGCGSSTPAGKPVPNADRLPCRSGRGASRSTRTTTRTTPRCRTPASPGRPTRTASGSGRRPRTNRSRCGSPPRASPPGVDVAGGTTDRTVTLKAEHRSPAGDRRGHRQADPRPSLSSRWTFSARTSCTPSVGTRRPARTAGSISTPTGRTSRCGCASRPLATAPRTVPEFRVGDDAGRTQDFRLQPSPPRTGLVLDPAGKAVPRRRSCSLARRRSSTCRLPTSTTGPSRTRPAGSSSPTPVPPWAVVARTDAGIAVRRAAGRPGRRRHPDAAPRGLRSAGRSRTAASRSPGPRSSSPRCASTARAGRACKTPSRPRPTRTAGSSLPGVPPGPASVRVHLGPWGTRASGPPRACRST